MDDWSSTGRRLVDWARRLDFVLHDRPALDAFRSWLTEHSRVEPLDLYFAIRAFERMADENDTQTSELAKSIYHKYISPRTATFLDKYLTMKLRTEIGEEVKSKPWRKDMFDSVRTAVYNYLCKQHEHFVSSDQFIDTFNTYSLGDKSALPLTVENLEKTRDRRFEQLGESAVERMYPGSSLREPYTCHATTSHNDSAVSSSFSSERAPTRSNRMRGFRDSQLRENPKTFTLPRLETKSEGQQFDHSTHEGRLLFAALLTKQLTNEHQRRIRHDETQQQLIQIERRKCTARELVSTSKAVELCDDDDVERYVDRMRDSNVNSNQLSPRHFSLDAEVPSMPAQFAPPPNRKHDSSEMSLYDSSGIGSLAPSAVSEKSRNSRKHASLAKKVRKSYPHTLTISYKGADGCPIVTKVATTNGSLTLQQFRNAFSLQQANLQFLFKCACEDGSAPHQWLLVHDENMLLPVFEGRVTAQLNSQ